MSRPCYVSWPDTDTKTRHSDIESLQLVSHLGKTVSARFIDKDLYGYVGQVTAHSNCLSRAVAAAGYGPVLASLGQNTAGNLNINADYLAAAAASNAGREADPDDRYRRGSGG